MKKYTTYGDLLDIVRDKYGGYYNQFKLKDNESRTFIRNQDKNLPEIFKAGMKVKIGDIELELKNDCKKVLDFYDELGFIDFKEIDGLEISGDTIIVF